MLLFLLFLMSKGWDDVSELQPIIHLPGDIWAWRTMVEWYLQEKSPDSSITALWKSHQQSQPVAKQEELEKEMMNFALQRISFIHQKAI
jgi:hypothetical protein